MIAEDIIYGCGAISVKGNRRLEISSICSDSRKACLLYTSDAADE